MPLSAIQEMHKSNVKITNRGVVYLLNRFLSKNGVSDTLIPSTIVEGGPKLYMG